MNKLALITGGTKGIGKAVAYRLAKEGYDLLLTYSSDQLAAEACAKEITSIYQAKTVVVKADVTSLDSIATIVAQICETNRKLDAVVLNAGLTYRASFEEMEPDEWRRVFEANVHYPTFLTQKLVDHIQPGASIVFTGSLMGIFPHSVSLAYGVTKSAAHALVVNLVKFLAPYNIRVNGVAPGFVDTEWQKTKPAEIRKSIESKVAAGRFCTPEELTDAYMLMIDNKYMNGEVLVIDGGYSYK
ncbi:MAG: SDR family NAD(P)-dependent oxidoreductase [Bacteroidales bacterium]